MPEYTLYVDVWLLRLGCNFIFEYLLLWATATVTNTRTKPTRLVLGSIVGTIHYLLYLLASLGLLPFYGFLRFLPVVVIISFVMILVAFYPLRWSRLVSVAGHFYGIGFVAAGAGMASAYLLGDLGSPQFPVGTLVSILTILLIAELGWGVVHERVVNRVYQVPLAILCDGVLIKIKALVDTGNNLKDPLNRQPVIIVEKNALIDLLPPELNDIITALEQGDTSAIDHLADLERWQTRVRLVPFSSIGKKNGLLIGFRPDSVQIGEQVLTKELYPTIAIHPYTLDPKGEYMALVPPHLVESSLHKKNPDLAEGGESHVSATSSEV